MLMLTAPNVYYYALMALLKYARKGLQSHHLFFFGGGGAQPLPLLPHFCTVNSLGLKNITLNNFVD